MQVSAKSLTNNAGVKISIDQDNVILAFAWFLVAIVATYLTTVSPEAQISGRAWCTIFSPTHASLNEALAFGHCGWCYVAAASFGASIMSLVKRA